jgi:hypothetical protein
MFDCNTPTNNRVLMKRLPKVATDMAPHELAYNLTRVMNIIGMKPLLAVTTGLRYGRQKKKLL